MTESCCSSRSPIMMAESRQFHSLDWLYKYMQKNDVKTNEYNPLLHIIKVYGMMITIHAFFLMGSVLFRKYHFIVCAALVVLVFAAMASLYNASGLYQHNGETALTIWNIVLIVFEAISITLFTWLAYRLFCRWQVVTHKFVNL